MDSNELFFSERSLVFLRRYLWLTVWLLLVLMAQSLWVFPHAYGLLVDKLALVLIACVSLVLVRRRDITATLKWYLWASWVVLSVQACLRYGLYNAAVLGYPLFVVAAAWLLGRRHALWMTAATTVLALALGLLESLGQFPHNGHPHPLVLMGVLIVALAIGTFLSLSVADNIREHHGRALELAHTLELRVAERTAHLERANGELAAALDTLQRTQHELVQSEKLASLGSLVAGVAHELNTPIGNAVMAASTLSHAIAEFAQRAQEKSMQRSTLSGFVHTSTELADLLLRSTQRAADLVASFKRVAVDRTSEHRRAFDLCGVVDELLQTLGPTLKRMPWRVEVQVPTGIAMDSYPGPLEQVLTNLILNAANHAFGGRSSGRITLHAETYTAQGGSLFALPWVRLQVIDDGCGMPPELVQRIFEPFFTTKLGQGGSGLGLSIAHTIVGTVLGGTLGVSSAEGHGTVFTVEMPCTAPAHAESVV